MITLPKGERKKQPTHCNLCGDKLVESNKYIYMGTLHLRCRKCLSKISKKYNEKRKKALKDSKLW